jgi:hypothetical protein
MLGTALSLFFLLGCDDMKEYDKNRKEYDEQTKKCNLNNGDLYSFKATRSRESLKNKVDYLCFPN